MSSTDPHPTIDATPDGPGAHTLAELASQPSMWRRAAATAADQIALLPGHGEAALVLGCGTSYYVGEAYARRRVAAGLGPTRAAIPSELDDVGDDEAVVLLSRSGTTGDLVALGRELRQTHRVVAIAGERGTPVPELVPEAAIILDYADEKSVMQTRFATTGLSLLRHSIGDDIEALARDGETALEGPLPVADGDLADVQHVVFLGTKWSAGVAQEAALKVREAAGFWTEAYPIFEYQHGPISCAGPNSLVWSLTDMPDSVAADIIATGARLEIGRLDAQAELVRVHRLAVALAFLRGRDPDAPPHLSRSVDVSEM
jgi:glutamine---fructose-6-phosphate transaminase (isomerizing)